MITERITCDHCGKEIKPGKPFFVVASGQQTASGPSPPVQSKWLEGNRHLCSAHCLAALATAIVKQPA